MRLVTPGGSLIDSTKAKSESGFEYTQNLSVGSAVYLVEDPTPGRWTVRHDASVDATVSAPVKAAIGLNVSMPDSSFATDETVPVTVSFSDQNTYEKTEISAQLRVDNPDGRESTKLGSVDLSETGPTTFEGEFSPSYIGSHSVAVDFSSKVGGESVLRRAVETIRVVGDSTNTAPDPPGTPTELSAESIEANKGQDASLDWSAPSSGSVTEYRVYRDTIPNPTRRVATVSSGETSYADTEAEGGTTYYYRVTAAGEGGVESEFSSESSLFLYPSALSVDIQRSFEEVGTEEGYRLVALPGAADEPLQATLSGEAGTDWQAWWDDGSSENYFQKFDGSDTFTFRAGHGFWLTSRSEWSVERSVEAIPLSGPRSVKIPLHEGWNIISNPFGESVQWSAVQAAQGGSLQPLWGFDGSFSQTSVFRPATGGKAYYFLNGQGADSLKIPHPEVEANSQSKTKARTDLLALSAHPAGKDGPTSTIYVGTDEEAEVGLGPYDVAAPPGGFSAVSLRLKTSGEAPSRRRLLATERRPPIPGDKGMTFTLRLQSATIGPVEIEADSLDAVGRREVRLIRPATGQSYDLRSKEAVTLQDADSTALRLAVGSTSYVQNQAQEALPDEVTLTSYPNPMRKQATLEYSLTEPTDVRVAVYDVLGRQVAVLENGRKQAGRHSVTLEGGKLSSGVYFGRLKTGDQTRTQKITVVR